MTLYIAVIIFIYGIIIGSFLNVCIYRIPNGMSIISPPSHCTNCGKRLGFFDLIPIFSWVFLKGKCRYCKSKVSPRYAVVELLTGLSFLPLFFIYGLSVKFIIYALMTAIFIVIFYIDLDHMIIPNRLVAAAFILAVSNYVFSILTLENADVFSPLIGMVSGSGLLFLIGYIASKIYKTEDTIGMGDVKLLIPIGLMFGWKLLILMMLLASVSTSIISIVLIKTGKKSPKDLIPFGPFIVASSYFVILFGEDIIKWYLSLF